MRLRTRLALLLAALAGLSAALVGLAGYQVTSSRFRGEIQSSLDQFAAQLALPNSADVTRSCTAGRDGGPGERRGNRGPFATGGDASVRRPGGPPPGALVQCLDRAGAVTLAPRLIDLPIDDADRRLTGAAPGTRVARNVRIDGRDYRMVSVAVTGGAVVQLARELSENTRVLSSLVRRFLLLVVGATALAGLAGAFVARRVARPLVQLTATAEDIASHGRLDVALPVTERDDETGRLTRSFSTMVDALRLSKLQQTQLVHDAGHELRTPLTSLRTNIGVLRRHPDLPDEQRIGVVDDLHAELAELTDLVDELVALASDADPNEAVETVPLAELARDVTTRWERRVGRSIWFDATEDVPQQFSVLGHPRPLARALSNLVSNAAKFSPPGTAIEVHLRRDGDTVEMTVRDHGPGIPDEDLPKIFDRFYRSTVHRRYPGSGLGLSIVSQVAEQHAGTVRAQNMSDGGARFAMVLPAAVVGTDGGR